MALEMTETAAKPWLPRYRVYWEDTDGGGVVYHSRYLNFMERARSDWLLAMNHPQVQMQQQFGCLFVVTAAKLTFLQPARLEDELEVRTDVQRLQRVSLEFAQSIRRVGDGQLLVQGEVKVACVRAEDFRPTRIPKDLSAAIMATMQLNDNQP